MAIRISIQDGSAELAIGLSASGDYAPDVANDLKARLIEAYQEALATKYAVLAALSAGDDDA